jgi:hypothetical protein
MKEGKTGLRKAGGLRLEQSGLRLEQSPEQGRI